MAKPALKAALLSPQRSLGDHPLLVVGPSLGTSSILWNRVASLLGNDYDVVAVHRDAPYQRLQDVVTALQKESGPVVFGAGVTLGSQD